MDASELDAFRRGDPTLFRRLVREHSPRLLAYARSYLQTSDEAHDAVQETWVRAWQHSGDLASAGSLSGWLTTICRNACLSELRRSRRREQNAPCHTTGSVQPGVEERAESAEMRRAVLDAVAELPPRQRDTLVLRLIEGLGTRETARLLGCAEGTVKAALHHALQNLRPKLRSWRHDVVSAE